MLTRGQKIGKLKVLGMGEQSERELKILWHCKEMNIRANTPRKERQQMYRCNALNVAQLGCGYYWDNVAYKEHLVL